MAKELDFEIKQRLQSRTGVYYRNIQRLGAGGNSLVYLVLAVNKEYRGALFALKVFTRISDEERLQRFQREAEFLRNCDHPAVMRVYDDGVYSIREENETSEYPFVVAEYLPKTLQDIMRGTMTTAERVSLTLQLLSALQYLDQHNPSVVHRDIKPQNIFVKGRSGVLGDFGLMRFLDAIDDEDREVFKESVGPGMPRYYRSPDLVAYARQEAPLTTKSDIFQLGLVVAEMFTGRNPLKPTKDLLSDIELEPLRQIPGALREGIRANIERMLTMDPATRPAAADLIDYWEGLFQEVVTQCHQLDGRVF
jgi:serine/threonine-protein kinase